MVKKILLSNGTEVEIEDKDLKTLYELIISEIFIPKYTETDDFNLAINVIIQEMNKLIKEYELKPKSKIELLNELENQLDKDIEELAGVAKIEILFLNLDDYIEDIKKIILSGKDKHEIRVDMANHIAPLTLFELGELFIFLGKEAFLK
jgi:hypothetical protein